VKYFAWDDAENAKLRADSGIGFENIVFQGHISAINDAGVASFAFRPNEPVCGFMCAFDGSNYSPCQSPISSLVDLRNGPRSRLFTPGA